MIAQNAITANEIMITQADFDRLRALIESPRYRSTNWTSLMVLKDELDRGTVVAGDEVPRRVVTMRSRVHVRDLKSDESETYTLVYPDEADINVAKLSVLAPLGMALLGSKVGQIVKFDAPAGQRRLKVERILYQPEAAGDFHL
jgi:regulator of nucleoside diphosphate kinase